MRDGYNKDLVVLEQVRQYGGSRDFDKLEEGDDVGPYKVSEVSNMGCDHPQRYWRTEPSDANGGQLAKGRCQVCGDTIEVHLGTLEKLVENGETGVELGHVLVEEEGQ